MSKTPSAALALPLVVVAMRFECIESARLCMKTDETAIRKYLTASSRWWRAVVRAMWGVSAAVRGDVSGCEARVVMERDVVLRTVRRTATARVPRVLREAAEAAARRLAAAV